ncbi:RNA polymerase sigma factor [Chryseolinea sp. T2]|uniref:RNA polymerase sigma factor n=1 Tax=Chryseolinea sp. T2 TaxID=3129255 RepID=UPI0030769EBB
MSKIESNQQDLLERLRSGDKKAISWLYDQYSAALYGVIYRMVRSHSKAESILEETFVQCLADIQLREQQLNLFTCMVRTAQAIVRNQLATETDGSEQPGSEPLKNDPQLFAGNGYLSLVEGLDTSKSEVVKLVYIDGMSLDEVAHLLNLSLEEVRAQLRCALVQIHANLQKQSKIA